MDQPLAAQDSNVAVKNGYIDGVEFAFAKNGNIMHGLKILSEDLHALFQRTFIDELKPEVFLIEDTLPARFTFNDIAFERFAGFIVQNMQRYLFHYINFQCEGMHTWFITYYTITRFCYDK